MVFIPNRNMKRDPVGEMRRQLAVNAMKQGETKMLIREWFYCKEHGRNAVYAVELYPETTRTGVFYAVQKAWGRAGAELQTKEWSQMNLQKALELARKICKERLKEYTHVDDATQKARYDDEYNFDGNRTHNMDPETGAIYTLDMEQESKGSATVDGMLGSMFDPTKAVAPKPPPVVVDIPEIAPEKTSEELIDEQVGDCDLDTLIQMADDKSKPKQPKLVFRGKK